MSVYAGGCSCGAVRFEVRDYLYVLVCHCDACKKRTGSAFGISVVVSDAAVSRLTGTTKTFTRIAETGRPVDYVFCPVCASTIYWKIKKVPDWTIFAGGAFDDVHTMPAAGAMYDEHALSWARPQCALSHIGEPDEAFRAALIEEANRLR
ncbi:MAG TPA: GFA family protein [Stellaceae bacterium]|jgi:hypothetical protein|nr:GFA family protein [Stellaceae bacterium]